MFKKLLSYVLLATIVAGASIGTVSAPSVEANTNKVFDNFTLNKSNFNPDLNEAMIAEFKVLRDFNSSGDKISAQIFDYAKNDYVHTLLSSPTPAGDKRINWDGSVAIENRSGKIADGTYAFVLTAIDANNSFIDFEFRNFAVSRQEIVLPTPSITQFSVTPQSFTPRDGETVSISFSSDLPAFLTLSVLDSNRNIVLTFNDYAGGHLYPANTVYTQNWNGKVGTTFVPEGTYTFRLYASNGTTQSSAERTVTIKAPVVAPPVAPSYFSVSPSVFSPKKGETTTIYFFLNIRSFVAVNIYNSSNQLVKTFPGYDYDISHPANTSHSLRWDGKNTQTGLILPDGSYKVVLWARGANGEGTTSQEKYVQVRSLSDPFNPDGRCGGYPDTQNLTGELCDAIQWVTNRGIFHGHDTDGTFRPFTAINRAETLKVTFLAFPKVPILPATGSNFGFNDVNPHSWYAPYVRTGKFYGMLHGYLNSTKMRPHKIINRVEFLKFMLEAMNAFTEHQVPGYEVSYFIDVDPKKPSHDWFFDYAGFAYQYGLYNTPGNRLRQGNDVQRGEVALLMYRMFKQNLL